MKIRPYAHRPTEIRAGRFDGTQETGDHLADWVRRAAPVFQLHYYDQWSSRMVLQGPGGTSDIYEGWWLILNGRNFEVLSNDEFQATYMEKTS